VRVNEGDFWFNSDLLGKFPSWKACIATKMQSIRGKTCFKVKEEFSSKEKQPNYLIVTCHLTL
jgi:hypothetical protein